MPPQILGDSWFSECTHAIQLCIWIQSCVCLFQRLQKLLIVIILMVFSVWIPTLNVWILKHFWSQAICTYLFVVDRKICPDYQNFKYLNKAEYTQIKLVINETCWPLLSIIYLAMSSVSKNLVEIKHCTTSE